jgi:hypothetical protein
MQAPPPPNRDLITPPRVEEPIILDGGVRDEARGPPSKEWMSRDKHLRRETARAGRRNVAITEKTERKVCFVLASMVTRGGGGEERCAGRDRVSPKAPLFVR